jgi:hypothetical protein
VRWEDQLSSGVQGQSKQHSETLSQRKKRKKRKRKKLGFRGKAEEEKMDQLL